MNSFDWQQFPSEHYVFHLIADSVALRDIASIKATQEKCYRSITDSLGGCTSIRINYFLYPTSLEVGIAYGDREPTNAFNRMPDSIHAVYNQTVKSIGFHEDAHVISYHLFGRPQDVFIREALAMHFDKAWWNIPNERWADYYYRKYKRFSFTTFLENDAFFATDCHISYPVCGAFGTFLIATHGMGAFIDAFSFKGSGAGKRLSTVYGKSPKKLEKAFQAYLQRYLHGESFDESIAKQLAKV